MYIFHVSSEKQPVDVISSFLVSAQWPCLSWYNPPLSEIFFVTVDNSSEFTDLCNLRQCQSVIMMLTNNVSYIQLG